MGDAATNKRNKRAGAAWESKLLDELRAEGFDVERLRLSGAKDEGDLVLRLGGQRFIVIEAKAGAMHPADFVRQATEEAKHFSERRGLPITADVQGIAVVKARGKGWRDAYALTTLGEYLGIR